MNIVDSSGWIEFFIGSKASANFRPIINQQASLLVPTVSILEVHKFLSKHCTSAQVQDCLNVMRRGRVIDLTDARAIAASDVSQTHKLAMADAVMYSAALEFKATFWTQDADYDGLPQVQYFTKT